MKSRNVFIYAIIFNLVFYPSLAITAGEKLPTSKAKAGQAIKSPVKAVTPKVVAIKPVPAKFSYNFLKELELNPDNKIAYELFKGLDSELAAKADLTRQWYDEGMRLLNIKTGELVHLIMEDINKNDDETVPKNVSKMTVDPSVTKKGTDLKADPSKNVGSQGILAGAKKLFGLNQKGATGQIVADVKTKEPFSLKIDSPKFRELTAEIQNSNKEVSKSLYDSFSLLPKISAPLRALNMSLYLDLRLMDLGRYKTKVLGVRSKEECSVDPILERHIPGYMTSVLREDYYKALAHLIAIHRFTQCGSVEQLQMLESAFIDTIEDVKKMYEMAMSGDMVGVKEKLGLPANANVPNVNSSAGFKQKLDIGKDLKVYEKDMTPALFHGAALNVAFALFNVNKAIFSRVYAWMCDNQKNVMESMQEGTPAFKMGLWGNHLMHDYSYFIPMKPFDPAKDKAIECNNISKNMASEILTPYGLNKNDVLEFSCANMPSSGGGPRSFGKYLGSVMNTRIIAVGYGPLSDAGFDIPLVEGLCPGEGRQGGGSGGGGGGMQCSESHEGKGYSVPQPMKLSCQPNPGAVPHVPGGVGDPSSMMSESTGMSNGSAVLPVNMKETSVDIMDWMAADFCTSASGEDPEENVAIDVATPMSPGAIANEQNKFEDDKKKASDEMETKVDDLVDAAAKIQQQTYGEGMKAELAINILGGVAGVVSDDAYPMEGVGGALIMGGCCDEKGHGHAGPGAGVGTIMEEGAHSGFQGFGLGLTPYGEELAISNSGVNPKSPATMAYYETEYAAAEMTADALALINEIQGGGNQMTDDSIGCNMAFKMLAMQGAFCKKSPSGAIGGRFGGPNADPVNPWMSNSQTSQAKDESGYAGGGVGGDDCMVMMGDACFDGGIECHTDPMNGPTKVRFFGLWDPIPNKLDLVKDPLILQKLPPFMKE